VARGWEYEWTVIGIAERAEKLARMKLDRVFGQYRTSVFYNPSSQHTALQVLFAALAELHLLSKAFANTFARALGAGGKYAKF
jgi:hypothetical protein